MLHTNHPGGMKALSRGLSKVEQSDTPGLGQAGEPIPEGSQHLARYRNGILLAPQLGCIR